MRYACLKDCKCVLNSSADAILGRAMRFCLYQHLIIKQRTGLQIATLFRKIRSDYSRAASFKMYLFGFRAFKSPL